MKTSFKRFVRKPWVIALLGLIVLLVIGVFAAQPVVTSKMEGILTEKLKERGLKVEWEGSFWEPLRGQHFSGLKISEAGGGDAPIAEIESIDLRPSLWQYFGSKAGSLDCRIDSSPLILRDEKGEVVMDDVSLAVSVGKDRVDINELSVNRDALSIDLNGEILLPDLKGEPEKFRPDLKACRTVFDILDIKGGKGVFDVSGTLSIDCTDSSVAWSAELEGTGKEFEWKGVRWTEAEAEGKVSSGETAITCNLKAEHGSTKGEVRNSGEEGAPFVIEGSLSDTSGDSNEYYAELRDGVQILERFEGSANLLELSKDVVGLDATRPDNIRFETFPRVELRNLKRETVDGETKMTIESIEFANSEPIKIVYDGSKVEVTDCSASVKFDGDNWIISESEVKVLDGTVNLSGSYREGVMRDSQLSLKNFRVEEVRRFIDAGEGKSEGNVYGDFQGDLYFQKKDWEGSGFLRLTDAPVVEVPLLDQVYKIFRSALPGVEREKGGEFEADFTKNGNTVTVSRFEALGGKSLIVTAEGEINLQNKRVQGEASGRLKGLPGVVTSPVTQMLVMDVSGPYDNLKVTPQGPVELVSGAVEGAVDAVKEAGEKTGEAIESVGEKAQEAVEDTGEAIKDGVEDTGEAIKDGVKDSLEFMDVGGD